ncbi:hypothetical protein AALP_AA8G152600 [Arabis alpina]|uniref:E2F/DP family winged-helix DNA-binding domain-containing protein n=1 Tax=Arabis alpina TaxID=50452 RepID=A0A087G781_ARAAL|nr:hypothetical protein AALP_AA8G152600 [Arabis alpina]
MDFIAQQSYSRKEKALGLLTSDFLKLYNQPDVDLFWIDDAAEILGVERRRIYDVVNILECIGIVARSGKNQYSWRGFREVPRVLDELREEGMREKAAMIPYVGKLEVEAGMREKAAALSLVQENSPSPKSGGRKDKSVGVLAQKFLKLFLCSNDDLIKFDDAANALLNEPQDPMNMKPTVELTPAKVRRLYDVVNVFSAMNLIDKLYMQTTPKSKPDLKWLGYEAMSGNKSLAAPASLSGRNEPEKRASGTEFTNVNTKRNKRDRSENRKPYGNQNTSTKVQQRQQVVKPNVTSFVTGPNGRLVKLEPPADHNIALLGTSKSKANGKLWDEGHGKK